MLDLGSGTGAVGLSAAAFGADRRGSSENFGIGGVSKETGRTAPVLISRSAALGLLLSQLLVYLRGDEFWRAQCGAE